MEYARNDFISRDALQAVSVKLPEELSASNSVGASRFAMMVDHLAVCARKGAEMACQGFILVAEKHGLPCFLLLARLIDRAQK